MDSAVDHVTLGVEEEFHVVDLESRHLVARGDEVLARLPAAEFAPELQRSVVESNSAVCTTLDELGADLRHRRGRLVAVAAGLGLGVAAAGTVPLVEPDDLAVTDDDRYRRMNQDYRMLVQDQLICGLQVHATVPDADAAVAVVRRSARWLPTLCAIAASSPFWLGRDSGYASFRSMVWQRWPTAGWPGPLADAAEYDHLVEDLIASGAALDKGMIYFDVRPSAHVPTVELRVCDACPRLDDALLVAGLFRALVRQVLTHPDDEPETLSPALYRTGLWRAARSGLGGVLVDSRWHVGRQVPVPVPAPALLRAMVAELREPLEAEGDWEQVSSLVENLLGRGTSAARQRALRRKGSLTDVVDLLLAESRGEEASAPVAGPVGAPPDRRVSAGLAARDRGWLQGREAARDTAVTERGLVFRVTGAENPSPFPVDIVPRVLQGPTWAALRAGTAQRARALDRFVDDVYGPRAAIDDGIVPAWVVETSAGHTDAGHLQRRGSTRTHVVGIDLVQDESAAHAWRVLEDNARIPSGMGYALQSRRVLDAVLPDLARPSGLVSGDDVTGLLRRTLHAAAAPRAGADPHAVLLSAGSTDSAWFEHQMLAEEGGLPLVHPAELLADATGVRRTTPAGPVRVDVIYRRIDEGALQAARGADGAALGPGLAAALRADTVRLANALGTGVADDKAVYAYVPRLIEYYLGEQPILENVPTYLCGDPEQRSEVLSRLAELVLKPVDGFGGQGVVIGPAADEQQLAEVRAQVLAVPTQWVAQELVHLSTHPTVEDGLLVDRHVDLRTFALVGDRVEVAPVALTRYARAGSMIVNSSRGGGCKDTWLVE